MPVEKRSRMLEPIIELDSRMSPAPLPHSIAVDGETVYIASRETRLIDVLDRDSWKKREELRPPGMPWGMAFGAGALVMTCGETDEDMRRIRRYVPHRGFEDGFVEAPDDTGSHLGVYGGRVLLGQWYNRRLLHLDDAGRATRVYATPHGVAGVAVNGDVAYLLGTDDEDHGEYWISRLDLLTGAHSDVATVPFRARSLAWDGEALWTNHREGHRTIRFALPA